MARIFIPELYIPSIYFFSFGKPFISGLQPFEPVAQPVLRPLVL